MSMDKDPGRAKPLQPIPQREPDQNLVVDQLHLTTNWNGGK